MMEDQQQLHQRFQDLLSNYTSNIDELMELAKSIEHPHLRLGLEESPLALFLEPRKPYFDLDKKQVEIIFELLKKTAPTIECFDNESISWLKLLSEREHEVAVKLLRTDILSFHDLKEHFVPFMNTINEGHTFSKSMNTCIKTNVDLPNIMTHIMRAANQANIEYMEFITQYGEKIQSGYFNQMIRQGWDCEKHNEMELLALTVPARDMLGKDHVENFEFEVVRITPVGYAAFMGNAPMMATLLNHGATLDRSDHLVFGDTSVKWGLDKINEMGHLNYPGTELPTEKIIHTHRTASSASNVLDELLATKNPPAP